MEKGFIGQKAPHSAREVVELATAEGNYLVAPQAHRMAQQKLQAHFTVARVVTAALFGDSFHGLLGNIHRE